MNDIDEDLLQSWLAQELEPICDAEPEVLAKYVRALLRDDSVRENPRAHCISELEDFLKANTETFVNNMFDAIESGSYKQIASYDNEEGNEDDEDRGGSWRRRSKDSDEDEEESSNRRRNYEDEEDTASKRRRRDEEGSSEHHSVQSHRGGGQGNGRDMPPRGGDYSGRRGQYDDRGGRQQWQDGRGGRDRFHHMQFPHMMMGRDGGGYGGPPMGMGYGGAGGSMGWGGGGIGYGGGYGGPGYMPPQRGPGIGMYNMPPIMGGNMYGRGGGYHDSNWGQSQCPPPHEGHMPRVHALLGNDNTGETAEHSSAELNRPPVPPGRPPAGDGPRHYMDRDGASGGGWSSHGVAPDEQCTLHLTGIPPYNTEAELYCHFATFGKIVKLLLRRLSNESNGVPPQAKVYNECLVQFVDAEQCRKCLNSPNAVLGNRFIKLFPSAHNLVPISEVNEVLHNGEEVYQGAHSDRQKGLWEGAEGGRGGRGFSRGRGRGGRGGRGFGGAVGGHSSYVNVSGESAGEASGDGDAGGSAVGVDGFGAGGKEEEGSPVKSKTPTHAQLEKERLRGLVLQQHSDLKNLRQKADVIWRQKEDLLQGQIDQFRAMMSKLETLPASGGEDKGKMMETLEGKIMALQMSLRDVRQQRETGVLPRTDASEEGSARGRGFNRGGRFAPRGRGRGRGRGFVGGNKTLDLRSKVLVVSEAPQELVEGAHQHFSRFGKVVKVITPSEDTSRALRVEFASRRDAEMAIKRAGHFAGQTVSMTFDEPAATPTLTGEGTSGVGGEQGPIGSGSEGGHE